MTINPSGWRPAAPSEAGGERAATFTGNRALMLEEALIFEIGDTETTGVDFCTPAKAGAQTGSMAEARHRPGDGAAPSSSRGYNVASVPCAAKLTP
jgi:glycine dehydrogenase subunit 2